MEKGRKYSHSQTPPILNMESILVVGVGGNGRDSSAELNEDHLDPANLTNSLVKGDVRGLVSGVGDRHDRSASLID